MIIPVMRELGRRNTDASTAVTMASGNATLTLVAGESWPVEV